MEILYVDFVQNPRSRSGAGKSFEHYQICEGKGKRLPEGLAVSACVRHQAAYLRRTIPHRRRSHAEARDKFIRAVLPVRIPGKVLARFPARKAVLAPVTRIAEKPANQTPAAVHRAMKGRVMIEKKTSVLRVRTRGNKRARKDRFGPFPLMEKHPGGKIERLALEYIRLKVHAAGAAAIGAAKRRRLAPGALRPSDFAVYPVKFFYKCRNPCSCNIFGFLHRIPRLSRAKYNPPGSPWTSEQNPSGKRILRNANNLAQVSVNPYTP